MPSERSIVIHGHFYQPPREDPWLDEVEREVNAAPWHDWNERIERECYRAVVAARVLAGDGRISGIVNTLERISFNFGPTLLDWLERKAYPTYAAVLESDRASRARCDGHGNAIAQPYHHAILPLNSRRDKVTEVRWGIADFRRRYGRDPEGMWLPETAVDDETLDVLAAEGIRFTILAPQQVVKPPADGAPALYRTGQGREIALFIYDGPISHGIAFGGLLNDAHAWAQRMLATPDPKRPPRLVSAATDGESYGHHHRFGEMALARTLLELERARGVRVENFASWLARHPATAEVELVAPSSWSCAHGVERWRSDCGCRMKEGTNQRWRAPLREAIDGLAAEVHARFEREGANHFTDPWAARDAYGAGMNDGAGAIGAAIGPCLTAAGRQAESGAAHVDVRALELLEMERDALRIRTSCGWFFDDIGGLEPLQVMRYAARAIDLAGSDGPAMEARLLELLADAESNDVALGTGRDIYLNQAKPHVDPMARIAAGVAAARRLVRHDPGTVPAPLCCEALDDGERVSVTQLRTGRIAEFDVSVTGDDPDDIAVVARPANAPDARPIALAFADLPEHSRDALRSTIRRRLAERSFSTADLTRFALDGIELRDATPPALLAAIGALENDLSPAAVGRVIDLVELLGQLGEHHIPFESQTQFHRLLLSLESHPEKLAAIEPAGLRLGFAAELFARRRERADGTRTPTPRSRP